LKTIFTILTLLPTVKENYASRLKGQCVKFDAKSQRIYAEKKPGAEKKPLSLSDVFGCWANLNFLMKKVDNSWAGSCLWIAIKPRVSRKEDAIGVAC
jgi:hypothetical protein